MHRGIESGATVDHNPIPVLRADAWGGGAHRNIPDSSRDCAVTPPPCRNIPDSIKDCRSLEELVLDKNELITVTPTPPHCNALSTLIPMPTVLCAVSSCYPLLGKFLNSLNSELPALSTPRIKHVHATVTHCSPQPCRSPRA